MTTNKLTAENAYLTEMLKQAGLDAQAQRVAAQLQTVLIEEIHHRMKNMLAMVNAIVGQSMRSAGSIKAAETAISARLIAMAKAHDLLLKADLKAADFANIVRGAIEQHDTIAGRISVSGPKLDIMPASILPLTLMLNELCTNATKYGALSNETGRVDLDWRLDADDTVLTINWTEKDGPAVIEPTTKSLGTRLIAEAIPRQLGGHGQLVFASPGVTFELNVPYEAIKPQILTLHPL